MSVPTAGEFMTPSPASCTPHDSLETAARLMAEHDCGAIPVVDELLTARPVGVITDRDVVIRVVAKGLFTSDHVVRDVMSAEPFVVHVNASFHDCAKAMEDHHIRRVLVVDDRGKVVGIITDGDLARACKNVPGLEHDLVCAVEEVSGHEPTGLQRNAPCLSAG